MTGAVRRAYEAVLAGIEPTQSAGRRVVFLVGSTNLARGDEATFAAAGLARQLARQGLGVRFVPRGGWYSTEYRPGELLLALTPEVDIRRLSSRHPVAGWVHAAPDQWRARPALGEYAALLAGSELAREHLAPGYDGPLGDLALGVDADLCADPYAWHEPRRSATIDLDPTARVDRFALPARYRGAALAVERVARPELGSGLHRSTLFDALACGAPVATNTALGLAELGLDGLPVFRSAGALRDAARRAAEGEFDELRRDLREVVRSRHDYKTRALAFTAFAEGHDLWHEPRRTGTVLNFYPDWSKGNPYQRMLYSRLPDDVRTVPSADAVSASVLRDDGGDMSDQVLHVHWQNYVVQPARNHADAEHRLHEAMRTITELLGRGLKLVWTIHNRLPHDLDYYFAEVEFCRFLAQHAHVVHVLSTETVDAVGELFDLDPSKIVLVEHGSYLGVYPELLDRATARERLGLMPSEKVVLFFGAVRPYKGLDSLIRAFTRLHSDDPTTRLLIVGQPGRTMDPDFLAGLDELPFVATRLGFVPESDVHLYFRAADVQVAPYTAVLNSGSVLLGVGYGLPVVAPHLGALRALEAEPFLFSYRAGDATALETAIRDALDGSRDPELSTKAVAYAQRYTGTDMSEAFVRDVLGRVSG